MYDIICEKCGTHSKLGDRVPYARKRSGLPVNYCYSCMSLEKSKKISSSNKKTFEKNPQRALDISTRAKLRYSLKTDEEKNIIKDNLKSLREEYWGSLTKDERVELYKKISESNKMVYSDPKRREKISTMMISHWNSLSDREKSERNEKNSTAQKERWSNLSEEDKLKRVTLLNEGFRRYWDSLSPGEIEDYRIRCRSRFQNMTPDEMKKLSSVHRQWWEAMDEESQRAFSESRKKYYMDLSDEEKLQWKMRAKDSWDNLHETEKIRINKARALGVQSFWKNITPEQWESWLLAHSGCNRYGPKDTEIEFESKLRCMNKSYEYQYMSQIRHPNFDKCFPSNPYNHDNKSSPYHRWDFIIHSTDKSIVIDIDGSIHRCPVGKWVVDGFDVGGYIQFKDSQRPYQTDGLDAYVILSYNDKLEKSTPVLSINSEQVMIYAQLLSIIERM